MLYIKLDNGAPIGYPISENMLRELLSNISLPETLDPKELVTLGFAQYNRVLPPEVGVFQVADEVSPEFDGTFVTQKFEIRNMSDQEKEGATQKQLFESRNKQRHLLSQSDWTELPSVVAKRTPEWVESWAAYRTAVRDIDKKPEWPFVTSWPEIPLEPLNVPPESV